MKNVISYKAGLSLPIFILLIVIHPMCFAQISQGKQRKNMQLVFKPPVGTIVGSEDDLVIRATGIPYAFSERFGKPKPFPGFEQPFKADKPAPAPAQLSSEMTKK